jgi:hypothetical protein
MDRADFDNDYYIGKYAGFLMTTTLFVALLFSWQSMKLDANLPKFALYALGLLLVYTLLLCGKVVFNLPTINLFTPDFSGNTFSKC